MNNDQDKLIDTVMKVIETRSHNTFKVESTGQVPNAEVFLANKKAIVSSLDLSLVRDLNDFNLKNPWVDWIQKGLSYDVEFEMKLGFSDLQLLPWNLVVRTPFAFISKDDKSINAIQRSAITRNDVMFLDNGSYLLKSHHQLITDYAKEELYSRKIETVERIEENVHGNCGW
ncbi:PduM family microcompartment protein [Companilactobacillus sp.]|jgi:microcompartment protein PduM|uniref:PduM family microcompartment protein n=1 Tax=Companilactobacillus sp. TaxID=2767905 RepID=UPI0025BDA6B1|nr:PduM family microcompartment protein [Companilactobacillus sp.]MCH4008646.1 PduM family microcompartment protein [Companilactobacillus sp.]MCH4051175.1 PduM family microcompartment protein [Companilactobacillus sp.]MCH4076589.1 PduM family microcompartment protein [Companilactobacillus sp.]MCH4125164.1 PduM family microcompartment protein [Companilactobacillus sp.]MCH4131704.1 PduM family microcompartment protein [Companilactobacillus sp.]